MSEQLQPLLARLTEWLRDGKTLYTGQLLNSLHPSEIADLLESVPLSESRILWQLVDTKLRGDVMLEIEGDLRETLIDATDPDSLLRSVEGLDVDELADLFDDLPATVTEGALRGMEQQYRRRLEQVLSYDEKSAGGIMDVDAVTVRPEVALDTVLRYLRGLGKLPEHTDSLIVVDRANIYHGMLPLSALLTRAPTDTVRDVMRTDIKGIPVDMPASEVARLFEGRDLVSAPVVEDARLVGRITVDDVVDVIRDEAHTAEFGAALLPADESLFTPARQSAVGRGLWLGFNLITAFLAAWTISLFQGTLEKLIALAALAPVVMSMGGIAGGQTLTLVVRGLATGQVGAGNLRLLLSKETMVGALNGVLWALIVAAITFAWFDNAGLSALLGAAILVNLLCAALAGVGIPLLLSKAGLDPALGGGVLLTTVTDVVGIVAFLGLATLLLV